MTWFLVTAPVIGAEGSGPIDAMRRSARLVSRRFWIVLGAGAARRPRGAPLRATPSACCRLLVSLFLGTEGIGWVLPAAVGDPHAADHDARSWPAITVLIYLDLRVRTEGLDLELDADRGLPVGHLMGLPPSEHDPAAVRDLADQILARRATTSRPSRSPTGSWSGSATSSRELLGSLVGGGGGTVLAWVILAGRGRRRGLPARPPRSRHRSRRCAAGREPEVMVELTRSAAEWRPEAERARGRGPVGRGAALPAPRARGRPRAPGRHPRAGRSHRGRVRARRRRHACPTPRRRSRRPPSCSRRPGTAARRPGAAEAERFARRSTPACWRSRVVMAPSRGAVVAGCVGVGAARGRACSGAAPDDGPPLDPRSDAPARHERARVAARGARRRRRALGGAARRGRRRRPRCSSIASTRSRPTQVLDWVRGGGTLVVTDPGSSLAPPVAAGATPARRRAPLDRGICTIDVARRRRDGRRRRRAALRHRPAPLVVPRQPRLRLRRRRRPRATGDVVAVGGAAFATNERLDEDDNAVLAAGAARARPRDDRPVRRRAAPGRRRRQDARATSCPTASAAPGCSSASPSSSTPLWRAVRLGRPVPRDAAGRDRRLGAGRRRRSPARARPGARARRPRCCATRLRRDARAPASASPPTSPPATLAAGRRRAHRRRPGRGARRGRRSCRHHRRRARRRRPSRRIRPPGGPPLTQPQPPPTRGPPCWPCARRSARSSSARRARCRASSPRCSSAATCCSRACRAWPRRCSPRRWPRRSTSTSPGCSSRPTSCRPT